MKIASSLFDQAQHGAVPTNNRVVFDGTYVTAGGVSAGNDMALTTRQPTLARPEEPT